MENVVAGISNEVIIKIAILVIIILLSVKLLRTIAKAVDSKVNYEERPRVKGLLRILRVIIVVIVALTCMSTLGINTSNILAVVAASLVALVVALRDYLANMAGGVMIMTLKPFEVGDFIITEQGSGTVMTIFLARTDLLTIDKKIISIPNGTLANIAVTNASTNPDRRLDIEVSVAYGTDMNYAKEVLERIYNSDPEVLKDRPIFAHALEFQDSGILMRVEGYVMNARYWDIRWRLMEAIAMELPKAGIEIPYNKMDVYMNPQAPTVPKDRDAE